MKVAIVRLDLFLGAMPRVHRMNGAVAEPVSVQAKQTDVASYVVRIVVRMIGSGGFVF